MPRVISITTQLPRLQFQGLDVLWGEDDLYVHTFEHKTARKGIISSTTTIINRENGHLFPP
jgi:hypothetical protein